MEQKKLIKKYKKMIEADRIDRTTAASYFRTAARAYKGLQDGVASSSTFFDYTIVTFRECEKPDREPDFTSNSGSRYWYYEDGVIRGADHWGSRVANCDWAYRKASGRTVYGQTAWTLQCFREPMYGFARWEDFILKPRLLEINGSEVLTTFNNMKGRDLIEVDGKLYQKVVVETWPEAEEENLADAAH